MNVVPGQPAIVGPVGHRPAANLPQPLQTTAIHKGSIVHACKLSRKLGEPVAGESADYGAKLWLLEIAVDHADLVSRRREALLQTQGDRDRPMSSASAADPDVQIAATLTLKQGN